MSEPGRTEPHGSDVTRDAAREALRELIPDLIEDLLGSQDHPAPNGHRVANGRPPRNGHASSNGYRLANGHVPEPEIVPLVPAPPIAAVLRPSTWSGPAVPGEVIGGDGSAPPAVESVAPAGSPAQPAGEPAHVAETLDDPTAETVRIDNDEDLQAFVRSLVTRLESPRDRLAIKAGRLRFRLERSAGVAGSPGVAAGVDDAPRVRVEKGAATERHVRDAAARRARLVLARGAVLTPLARDCARSLGVQIEREGRC